MVEPFESSHAWRDLKAVGRVEAAPIPYPRRVREMASSLCQAASRELRSTEWEALGMMEVGSWPAPARPVMLRSGQCGAGAAAARVGSATGIGTRACAAKGLGVGLLEVRSAATPRAVAAWSALAKGSAAGPME